MVIAFSDNIRCLWFAPMFSNVRKQKMWQFCFMLLRVTSGSLISRQVSFLQLISNTLQTSTWVSQPRRRWMLGLLYREKVGLQQRLVTSMNQEHSFTFVDFIDCSVIRITLVDLEQLLWMCIRRRLTMAFASQDEAIPFSSMFPDIIFIDLVVQDCLHLKFCGC